MQDSEDALSRHHSLDALRGIAVMGIVLMNIISFGFPEEAQLTPRAPGGTSPADLWTWATMFVIVDGKMRGLFSLLFGASMMLVINRAEAKDEDATAVHRKRMLWLLLIGLVHGYLIWSGDILTLYAICGMIAAAFVKMDKADLIRWSIGLIAANWFVWGGSTVLAVFHMESTPDAISMAQAQKAYGGSYFDALAFRMSPEEIARPIFVFLSNAMETIGLFTLGMVLLKTGFLTGTWAKRDYMRTARTGYLIGLAPLAALAAFAWSHGFDKRLMLTIEFALAPPFRIAVMMGHVAVLSPMVKHFSETALVARVAAAGRAAFSNYLGTSIVMTTLFYGYGLGLYGQLSRWQAYLIVPLTWGIMLLWSKPWLDHFHYGPAEWLWRSLARGVPQPMLKQPYQKRDGAA
jgi:uncharacterized protein